MYNTMGMKMPSEARDDESERRGRHRRRFVCVRIHKDSAARQGVRWESGRNYSISGYRRTDSPTLLASGELTKQAYQATDGGFCIATNRQPLCGRLPTGGDGRLAAPFARSVTC